MNGVSIEVGLTVLNLISQIGHVLSFSKKTFEVIMCSLTAVSILAAVTSIMAMVLILLFKAFERFVHQLTMGNWV